MNWDNEYDALLVLSFGGPEGPDDVIPFLENVTRGRGVPRERLLEVAEHYRHFGGVSPINAQNRALIQALERELAGHGLDLPIYFGNRNWHPFLRDTVTQMRADGVRRALAFVTSGFSCYSGCRQYREDLAGALDGVTDLEIDKLRVFYNHPGFIEASAANLRQAIAKLDGAPGEVRVAFTAHSIPMSQATTSDYERQLREASRLVAEACGVVHWDLVYQSRSGPPRVPWIEPDILDHMRALHQRGGRRLVILPIGFISDHMEVLFDLDTEAAQLADELGLTMVRAATVGTALPFMAMIRELIEERLAEHPTRRAIGQYGPNHDVCPPGCCEGAPRGRT